MNAGFEGAAPEGGGIARDVLYDHHSFKSAKRFALTVLLLRENIGAAAVSRVVGVSTRQIYSYRGALPQ